MISDGYRNYISVLTNKYLSHVVREYSTLFKEVRFHSDLYLYNSNLNFMLL